MVSCGQWSAMYGWKGRRMRHGWPVAFVLAPPVALGLGVAGILVLTVGLAVVLTVAAVAFTFALVAGIFCALGFVLWQVARHAVPGLAGVPRASRRRQRTASASEITLGRQLPPETPVDALRRRYAAGEIGQTAFRQQLTDLLKERYVRGDLTLGEFEARVGHLYQDPALRPPAA